MPRRLPLTALWVFEAAARHENLTAAATELHLTHAAVSRHMMFGTHRVVSPHVLPAFPPCA